MAGESNKGKDIGESFDVPATEKKDNVITPKKKKKGIISRIWNGLFRLHGDDFEKRLEHISKEEAAIIARMKRRSQSWRRTARNVIIFSVILEVIAVGFAIMTTRSLELNWKMRALRVLPMFLLPGLSSIAYSGLASFTKMRDQKDQKTLERLRAERQEKIDELKEKTNYYSTQQLIQKYDLDPAAKAAAATVLASKLGADSGLKVYVGDESRLNFPMGKSNDVELAQTSGLRNRKQPQTISGSPRSPALQHTDEEMLHVTGSVRLETSENNPLVVEHHQPGASTHDGGWLAQIAALLVGEDPTQCFALICGNCHMHNGLARKEDFPYITYYCPHCKALNRSNHLEGVSGSEAPTMSSSITSSNDNPINTASPKTSDAIVASSSPVAAVSDTTEGSERVVSTDPDQDPDPAS
ncbi:uncharacterized protein At2g24330-like isoform X2 [Diospyros lotus]|nr:uncharacterized protein At2g24330-like isoform X2 [Diospyros lotus]XP_052206981.1 uncharacterized protein At2g24330-like isoform X2 [Diospyros lotus]